MLDNKSKIFRLPNLYVLIVIALTYTAAQFWPVFSTAGLFILIGCLLPFLISPKYFTSNLFLPLAIYLTVVFINVVQGDKFFPDNMQLIYETSYLLIPSSMVFYVNNYEDNATKKSVVYSFLIILCLTTIATVLLAQTYPGVIRHSNTYSHEQGDTFYKELYHFGLATYDITHAVPCLVPVLFYSWRIQCRKGMKALLFCCIITCLVLSYVSGSFACLVLTIAGIIISFFLRPGSIINNLTPLVIFGILLLLVLSDSVILSITSFLENFLGPKSDFHDKIMDIQRTIETGESQGDFATRKELYGKSYNSFGGSIILGSDGSNLGGHSAFLDRLGSLGLIGFIPYAVFIWRCMVFSYNTISNNSKVYYLVGAFIALAMLSSKALSGWDMWLVLFFVLPSILQVFEQPTYESAFDKTEQ